MLDTSPSDDASVAAADQTSLSLCRDPNDSALTFEEKSHRAQILRQQSINDAAVDLLSDRVHGIHTILSVAWCYRPAHKCLGYLRVRVKLLMSRFPVINAVASYG